MRPLHSDAPAVGCVVLLHRGTGESEGRKEKGKENHVQKNQLNLRNKKIILNFFVNITKINHLIKSNKNLLNLSCTYIFNLKNKLKYIPNYS